MTVDHRASEFAQGLLVEAIDASYKMGFVEAIALGSANPMRGATKTIKGFGRRAFQHWFKHATVTNLRNARVYESVRVSISLGFGRLMGLILGGEAQLEPITQYALVKYPTAKKAETVWIDP